MQAYVNRFSIALSQDKSEAMVNFFQNVPVVAQDDESAHMGFAAEMPTDVIPVANLVMTGDCAHHLAMTLLTLLEQEPPAVG